MIMNSTDPEEESENGGLRLVPDSNSEAFPVVEKQFVNFIFFRVNPEWRKLNSENQKSVQIGISKGFLRILQATCFYFRTL